VTLKRAWVCVLLGAAILVAQSSPAIARQKRTQLHAARHHHPSHRARPGPVFVPARLPVPPEHPPEGPYVSALLIDAESGRVLFAKDPTDPRPPASMVKMMTALLAFEALERGDIHLDDPVKISLAASRTGGSGIFSRPASGCRSRTF
jgi:D-alanyl-D-alanine carboxypeptidase